MIITITITLQDILFINQIIEYLFTSSKYKSTINSRWGHMMQKETTMPDFKLMGKVIGDGFEIESTQCEIYLSKELGKAGRVRFTPQKRTEFPDNWYLPFSFQGNQMMAGGEDIAKTIYIKKLQGTRRGQILWGEIKEPYLTAEIDDILIETPIKSPDITGVTGHFLLSPNKDLEPFLWLTPSYTGEIILERPSKCFSITLKDNTVITFDTLFKSNEGKSGEIIQVPYLVAKFELPNKEAHYSPSYHEIDKFLLIVSLITGHNTVCVGWVTYSAYSMKEHFRRRSIASKHLERSREFTKLKASLSIAYESYKKSNYPEKLIDAVAGTINRTNVITSDYLILYATLETLVQIHIKEQGMEHITGNFKKLRKNLEKVIKETIPNDSDKAKRELLYKNLAGINRIPFLEAFHDFQKYHSISSDDLWPLSENPASLTNLRHKITHGHTFNDNEWQHIVQALHQLIYLVERCLFIYLGIDKNEANHLTSPVMREEVENSKSSLKALQNVLDNTQ